MFPCESESRGYSDFSTVSSAGAVGNDRLARIRGESLRCLYMLVRSQSLQLVDHWEMIMFDTVGRPGLEAILELDDCVHARRFALYTIVSLLRVSSPHRPIEKQSKPCTKPRHAPRDKEHQLRAIHRSVVLLLKSADPGDESSVRHIIADYVSRMPWSLFSEKDLFVVDTFNVLIEKLAAPSSEPACDYLSALALLLPHCPVSQSMGEAVVSTLHGLCNRTADETICLWSNVALFHVSASRPLDPTSGDIIERGVDVTTRLLMSENDHKAYSTHFIACLANAGLLTGLSVNVMTCLEQLVRHLRPGEIYDSFMVGIGKASRKSKESAIKILSLEVTNDSFFPKLIQSRGDLLFSCFLFGVKGPDVDILREFMQARLCDPVTVGIALRAFMTGLSRLREAGDIASVCGEAHASLLSLEEWLLERFRTIGLAGDERLVADTVRTLGLLEPLLETTGYFRSVSLQILREAVTSRRTQVVLSAIFSLGEVRLDPDEGREVSQALTELIHACIQRLEGNVSWDYQSGPMIVGLLHVCADSLDLAVKLEHVDLVGSARESLRYIAKDPRMKKLFKYFPLAEKYASRILDDSS